MAKTAATAFLFQTLVMGADHGGVALKETLKQKAQELGVQVVDVGTKGTDAVDYPDIVQLFAAEMKKRPDAGGVLVCGSGIGMSIGANRYPFLRAALCDSLALTTLARQHNNANTLVLGGRFLSADLALEMLQVFLKTPFEGGRHARRVQKLAGPE